MATEDTTSADDDAVSVDLYGSPPPEVMAAIANASTSYDLLAEQGLHVSFDDGDGDDGAGFSMTLQDDNGTERSLSASDVLALADGKPLSTTRTSDVNDQLDD